MTNNKINVLVTIVKDFCSNILKPSARTEVAPINKLQPPTQMTLNEDIGIVPSKLQAFEQTIDAQATSFTGQVKAAIDKAELVKVYMMVESSCLNSSLILMNREEDATRHAVWHHSLYKCDGIVRNDIGQLFSETCNIVK